MAKKTTTRTRRRTPLSRERVLSKAVELADEGGIEALSMRRLARELGVEAMSLYNHVANKDDLLNGITELVLSEIEVPPDELGWKEALRANALSVYSAFRRHGWAGALVMSPAHASALSVQRADWTLRRLREAGFSDELTYHAFHALDAHVLGFTLWQRSHGIVDQEHLADLAEWFMREFPATEYPHMHEHVQQHVTGLDEGKPGAFELVLDLILDGLERLRDGA